MSLFTTAAAVVRVASAPMVDIEPIAQDAVEALSARRRTLLDIQRSAWSRRHGAAARRAIGSVAHLHEEAIAFLALYRDQVVRYSCGDAGPTLLLDLATVLCGAELRLQSAAFDRWPLDADCLPDDLSSLAPAVGFWWALHHQSPVDALQVAGLALRARLAALVQVHAAGARGHALAVALAAYIDAWKVIEGHCYDRDKWVLLRPVMAGRLCERLIGAELSLILVANRAARPGR